MKLKSLKITLLVIAVLSLQSLLAEEIPMTVGNCKDDNFFDKMTSAQMQRCQTLRNSIAEANGDQAKIDKAEGQFASWLKIDAKKASEAATAATAAQAGKANGTYCSEENKDKEPAQPADAETNYTLAAGSSGLTACERLSRGSMKLLYSPSGVRSTAVDWVPFIDYACKDKCGNQTQFNNCKEAHVKIAKRCEASAYLIAVHDRWGKDDNYKADKGTTSKTSGVTCKTEGVETLDYDACMKFQSNSDIIEGVQGVAYATQTLVYKDKLMDAETKNASEQNAATGALKNMRDSVDMQKQMYEQRTAVDAGKLAILYSIYEGMPTQKTVSSYCDKIPLTAIVPVGTVGVAKPQVSVDDCKAAARAGQGGFALLMNQQQSEAMKSKLISIATSAGSNVLLASLMNKRSNDIDGAIAKIDAFKPLDPFVVSEEDARTTFCAQNPGLPQCLGEGLDRTFDTMNDNVITFGAGGTGTNYGGSKIPDGETITGSGGGATNERKSVGSVGSVITGADSNNTMETATAATVSDGTIGSTGGGGGGGSSGGGGSGGGGAAPAAGNPGGVQAAVQGKTPSYGGGGGSFSVVGGFGINKSKGNGKGEDNPFGKLFGKEGPKGSGVVNFRDIASQKVGGKGDNLFDMISKRYSSVNADKRLIEYELTK